jgi:hypothetical protein
MDKPNNNIYKKSKTLSYIYYSLRYQFIQNLKVEFINSE